MAEKTVRRKIRASRGDRIFSIINGTILFLFFLVTLYPMYFVVIASFSEPMAVATGKMVLLPVEPSLQAYQYIFQYREIWVGYANTVFYTVVGTMLNIAVTLPCAYALSRRDLVGRGFIMTLFVITMYFGGGLIPSYLNIREFGLLDNRLVLIIPGCVSAYNLIVARTFFSNSIPWELHEAAFLDGCSNTRLFLTIIMPLSSAITVVLILYYGVGHWNAYFNAMIYLRDRAKFPLQVFLREILMLSTFMNNSLQEGGAFTMEELIMMQKQKETADMLKYGIIVVATAPMMVIYPFVQKYFAKGVMIGSVKG